MRRLGTLLAGLAFLFAAVATQGATGEDVYRAKCSLCHDGGATGAPRTGDPAAWALRLAGGKEPVYQNALKGKSDSAMLPKGGFPELSDVEVRAAVDHMLFQSGHRDAPLARAGALAPGAASAPTAAPRAVDDGTITAAVAEALRAARDISPPSAQIETYDGVTTIRGVGIKVETRAGVVTLQGVVEESKVISRAEAVARAVAGVKAVDNKLIASSIFEHD